MRSQNSFKKFIFYSVSAHIVVLIVATFTTYQKQNTLNEQPVEITLMDSNPLKNEPPNLAKLIVETESQTANDKIDDKSKYLSEKNNQVAKETRAKAGLKFNNAKQFQAQTLVANTKPKQTETKKTKPDLFKTDFDAYSLVNKKSQTEQKEKTDRHLANTNSEASTTNDNLKNLESDLITRLNTREYKYFGYYSRIKNQLNQWWVPQVQKKFTKMMQQGRTIASEENKITKLVIILNEAGNLVKVQVLAESGVRDLDDAAVEAFRQAAPFPNPPKGMVEHDGTVKIRWDCVVES